MQVVRAFADGHGPTKREALFTDPNLFRPAVIVCQIVPAGVTEDENIVQETLYAACCCQLHAAADTAVVLTFADASDRCLQPAVRVQRHILFRATGRERCRISVVRLVYAHIVPAAFPVIGIGSVLFALGLHVVVIIAPVDITQVFDAVSVAVDEIITGQVDGLLQLRTCQGAGPYSPLIRKEALPVALFKQRCPVGIVLGPFTAVVHGRALYRVLGAHAVNAVQFVLALRVVDLLACYALQLGLAFIIGNDAVFQDLRE